MLTIPKQHKATIRALVEADPEVAQATCDIPHIDPSMYLVEGSSYRNVLPYCGCFVGVYAWMQECKAERKIPTYGEVPFAVSDHTPISCRDISEFGGWCITPARDQLAVKYAKSLLVTAHG